jgi:hypothetical protein
MTKHTKDKLESFVPLLVSTMDSQAWKAATYGARVLYLSLCRRRRKGRNRVYLSFRDAEKEIGATSESLARWFDELEHYGFIVKVAPGALGIDGKGKSPHWRLTAFGQVKEVTPDGLPEPPSRNFLNWDGTKFRIPPGKLGHPVLKIRTRARGKLGRFVSEVSLKSGHKENGKCPKNPGISSYHLSTDSDPAVIYLSPLTPKPMTGGNSARRNDHDRRQEHASAYETTPKQTRPRAYP